MTEVTVRELMQEHPLVVKPYTTLVEAVELLINQKLSELPVVSNNNDIIGFISEYDCHKAMLISSYHCDNPVYVNDIINKNYAAIAPDEGIADISIKLLAEPSSLYLVAQNKQLIGTLTRHDILNTLNKSLTLCSQISKKMT